jgi:hypothetical protein
VRVRLVHHHKHYTNNSYVERDQDLPNFRNEMRNPLGGAWANSGPSKLPQRNAKSTWWCVGKFRTSTP